MLNCRLCWSLNRQRELNNLLMGFFFDSFQRAGECVSGLELKSPWLPVTETIQA